MQLLKRIFFFISLFALYIILRELLEFYAYAYTFHPYAGYVVLLLILGTLIYFVFIPVYRIMTLPVNPDPVSDQSKEAELIDLRVQNFKKNKYLKAKGYKWQSEDSRENFNGAIKILNSECEKIRQKYVAQLFYSSSISQNGFIDAVLVLSYSVNMIKEIFILYHGRVNNRDLWQIAKKVYYSMAIAGSEGIEYVTDEIITKLASDGIKSVPFIDKILGSIADGFLNALLLNRVSYITENYCTMTYLEKSGDLYPSPARVFKATKHITFDITNKLIMVIKRISIDKTINFAVVALNPIGYVWEKTFDRLIADKSIDEKGFIKNLIIETGKFAGNPVTYGIGKIYSLFKLTLKQPATTIN